MSRLRNRIVAGDMTLARRPKTFMEECRQWARHFGIKFKDGNQAELEETIREIKSHLEMVMDPLSSVYGGNHEA